MKVSRKNLLAALEVVKPGLSGSEVIEQSTSFAFMKGRVITYNDMLSLSCEVEGLELNGAVKAAELYMFLKKLKGDELELEEDDNQIKLKSGKAKAGLVFDSEIKLPLDEIGGSRKWKKIPEPEKFIRLIKFAMGGCSRDNTYPVLTCVSVNSSGIIEGSDSYRIVRCDMGEQLPIKSFLLPANLVRELIKIKPTEISKGGEGWIHFKAGETVLSCRTFDGEYPPTEKFMKMKKGINLSFPDSIVEGLERAWVFAKRDDVLSESINLKIKGNKLEITAKSDFGWSEEPIKLKDSVKDGFEFSIIPYLLIDILKETKTAIIGDGKLVFESPEKDWKYLTVLISE